MALGDLYFDVLFRDKTDQGINAIKSKLSKSGVEVGTDIAKGIEAQLKNIKLSGLNASNLNVKATLNVDKIKILTDIQDALSKKQFTIDIKAKSNITTNANKSALAYETEAQAKLINAQARLLQAQNAQAVSAQKAALAQAKLATEHQKTAREANRAQIEATKLARQKQMLANATNRATQSARNYTNANRGVIGSLREMTGLAGKFSAIYMGGQFLSSLIKIRGEFEMQLVSLRAILQSTERANELYGQLQRLSVISPFQFGDLVKYAKQLSAYQIPTQDLYDTTKRLADLSAGLGVDMNRLILAYGQVKSAAVLRGTELRQFTEAGLPMVSALADKFSELEGRVVATGEVFDKISNREVPFQMVKEVLEDLTNEGGIFFEMQEKQAATLKGQISNLKDAYAIMMNEIGKSQDGLLKTGVGAIRWSLQNYEELLNILMAVVAAYGAYRIQLGYKTSIMGKDTQATLTNALAEKQRQASLLMQESHTRQLTTQERQLIATRTKLTATDYEHLVATSQLNAAQIKSLFLTGKITKAQFQQLATMAGMTPAMQAQIANLSLMGRVGERLKLSLAGVGRAFKALGATMKASWPMLVIGLITELIMQFSRLGDEQKRINEEMVNNAKQNLADLNNFYHSHSLSFGEIDVDAMPTSDVAKLTEKIVEKIRQLAPNNSIAFEAQIMMQDGDETKLKKAKEILDGIGDSMSEIGRAINKIKIDEDSILWGAFGEGLAEDAEDFSEATSALLSIMEANAKQGTTIADLLRVWDSNRTTDAFKQFGNGGIYSGNNIRWTVQNFNAELNEAKSEIDEFYEDNIQKLDGLKGEARKAAIQSQISVLKEQFKSLDPTSIGILVNYYESKVGNFYDSLTHIVDNFTDNERKQIQKMKGDYAGANKDTLDKIVLNTKERLGLIYLDAETLAKNISLLEAIINVKLNIETGGNLSDLQKAIGANMQFFGNEKSYERVQKMFEGVSSYAEIEKIIQEQYAKLKGVSDAIKKQKNLNEAQQKELQNANADMKTIETLASNLGVSHIKPTTKGKKSQVDQVAKALQDQYKELKKLYDEWEKLSKLVGNENAKAELAKMSGFKELFEDANLADLINKMLTDGGDLELVKEYLKKVKGMTSKEALSFVETLEQTLRSIQTKDLTESVEKAVERINDALDVNIKKYQEWEKYYESTGNKSIASLLAYGDANAIIKTEVELRTEALRLMQEQMKLNAKASMQAIKGNVDLFNRPIIQASKLAEKGWENVGDGIATVFSSQYGILDNKGAVREILITPILPNGDVLSEKELEEYIHSTLEGSADILNADQKGIVIAVDVDENLGEKLHLWQEEFYSEVHSFEKIASMGAEEFHTLPEEVQKAFKEAQDAVDAEASEINAKFIEAYISTMSIDEQVKALEEERDKLLQSTTDATLKKSTTDYYAKKIGELKAKALELLPVWERIFGDSFSYGGIKEAMGYARQLIDNATPTTKNADGTMSYMSSFIDANGVKQEVAIVSDQLKDLKKQYGELFDSLAEKNPFKAFVASMRELTSESRSLSNDRAWRGVLNSLSGIFKMGAELSGSMKTIFDATGLENVGNAMNTAMILLEGTSNIAQAYAQGDDMGAMVASAQLLANTIADAKWRSSADEEEAIEELEGKIRGYQSAREMLENSLRRELGIYGEDGVKSMEKYAEMVKTYEEEIAAREAQLAEEKNKKESDQDATAIADYEAEIDKLNETVRYFAEDTLKDLMGIDLKEWANNFGDALVEAFASGEDAASAFDKTVADLMKNVVKNMASLYILEPALKELQTYLFGEDGYGGVFGSDRHFSEEDLAGMKPYLDRLEKETIPAVEDLFEAIDTAMGGVLSSSSNLEGLSGGIKSITEDTANLLASYLNAVRADVALIAMGSPRMTTIAEAQLAQLNVIATNTSRSAVAVEAINTLLKSVTTTTSSGRVLKV